MKQDGPEPPGARHDFEINPAHPIMSQLDAMRQKDGALATSVAEQIPRQFPRGRYGQPGRSGAPCSRA